MKLAIIGSRDLLVPEMAKYIPEGVTEIVSGGAKGIDRQAAEYARGENILLTEFLPHYERYGRVAPLKRNEQIAAYADAALIFWDGKSKGTLHTLTLFQHLNKKTTVIYVKNPPSGHCKS